MQCVHCKVEIVKVADTWHSTSALTLSQYCWVDPVYGSQLHEPMNSTEVESAIDKVPDLDDLLSRRAVLEQQLRECERKIKDYLKEKA